MLIRWTKFKTPKTLNAGKDVEQHELSFFADEMKIIQPPGNHFRFLTKLTIVLPSILPATALLGIYPNVENMPTHKHKRLHVYSSFMIAKTWKQPRCPSVGIWINKLWYMQIMEYSMLKRNRLSSHEKIRRNL